MTNRSYKLYCATQFLLNRQNYIKNSFGDEKEVLKKSCNNILKEIKELLQLEDTTDILNITHDSITVPKKYYNNLISLLPENRVLGFLQENTIIKIN